MKRIVFLVVLSVCLSGCAITTDRIDLTYVPQSGISKIPDANNVIVRVQVIDQRQEKSNKVSSKKNSYGMEMAPIIANEDVTVTIRRAIEQELQSYGFSIGTEALVSILADVTRFWNDHKMGFFSGNAVADLNMNITVKNKKGNILYNRYIQTQGTEENTQLATGNNARLALNDALAKGMKLLFEDQAFIQALMSVSEKSPS